MASSQMTRSGVLAGHSAVIYGAAGSLGSAVAKAFAQAGATVLVTGRTMASVKTLADEIIAGRGRAEVAEVNALDARAVEDCVTSFVARAGRLDISFNAVGLEDHQGIPLIEMTLTDFIRPIQRAMETQFITATAGGRAMARQRSGVILSLTATPGGIGYPNVGGFGPACGAIESFSRDLASELGPAGVRVVNIRSAGSPDSRVFRQAIEQGGDRTVEFIQKLTDDTMLKALPSVEDIANVAVFLASPLAGKITGVTIDVTCGTTSALNYKIPPITFVESARPDVRNRL